MTQPAGQQGQQQQQKKGLDLTSILGGALFQHPVFGKIIQNSLIGNLFPDLFQQLAGQGQNVGPGLAQPGAPQGPQVPQIPQGQPPQQPDPRQFLGI